MSNIDTTNTEIPTQPVITGETVDNTLPITGDAEEVENGEDVNHEEDAKQESLKRQSRLDRRFKDLTTKVKTAAADAQAWRETLVEVTGQQPPVRADFADQADYFAAVEDYREAIRGPKTMLQQAEREQTKAATELQNTLMERWDDKVSDIEAELPDFHEIVSATNLPISTVLQNAILKHPQGPRIVYYLATHPETAHELVSMPIEEQILELSEIGSKRVRAGRNVAPAEEKITPPAPPASRRIGLEQAPVRKNPGQMSLEEFSAWRNAGGKQ